MQRLCSTPCTTTTVKFLDFQSYDEHCNLQCAQYQKKLDEKGRVYLEYTDFGKRRSQTYEGTK